jgi:predicted molibdopterin-dependent oxidoreductase YjgC
MMSQLTVSELDKPKGELVQNESRELIKRVSGWPKQDLKELANRIKEKSGVDILIGNGVVSNVRKVSHDK